jgi:hypothetical protein
VRERGRRRRDDAGQKMPRAGLKIFRSRQKFQKFFVFSN